MSIDKDLLDRLTEGRSAGDLFGETGILAELTKALADRVLSTEMDVHLDEERAEEAPEGCNQPPDRRNGSSQKTVSADSGKVVLDIPRDRNSTFDPMLIAKYQRRFPEFDRKIVSMYARRMTTREIQGHIEEIYGVEASPNLISAITDAVMEEVIFVTVGKFTPQSARSAVAAPRPDLYPARYASWIWICSRNRVRRMQNEITGHSKLHDLSEILCRC